MTSALLAIDVQNEYFTGRMPIAYPPREGSLANIVRAMRSAAEGGLPVIVVQHIAADPEARAFRNGSAEVALHADVEVEHRDALVVKQLPGSFTGTDLTDVLARLSVDHLVVCGYMTHMCCDTTARQATHRGIGVTLLSDATGTIDLAAPGGGTLPAQQVHETELAVLGSRFATVTSTDGWIDLL